jgi:hypothetical protein
MPQVEENAPTEHFQVKRFEKQESETKLPTNDNINCFEHE